MEHWKTIPTFPLYEASTLGRIRRPIPHHASNGPNRVLTAIRLRDDYDVVTIGRRRDGQRFRKIHHLVLETFIGPRGKGMVANHKNGNKRDNRLKNLEWATRSYNQWHMYNVLHALDPRGANAGKNLKLTVAKVRRMKTLIRSGKSDSELAPRFGVSRSMINYIRNGHSWSNVK